jgi:ABC-type sugar transport system permease subunit
MIIVNTWRGLPFFAVSFLAGLMTIPKELYEAAETDGRRPAVPLLAHHGAVPAARHRGRRALLDHLDVRGLPDHLHPDPRRGPINKTQIFAAMAYDVALVAGRIGEGSAIALFLFPALLIVVIVMMKYLRQE